MLEERTGFLLLAHRVVPLMVGGAKNSHKFNGCCGEEPIVQWEKQGA